MEVDSIHEESLPNRRRSGRVSRKPGLFAEEDYEGNYGSSKRKRAMNGAAGNPHDEDDDDESPSDESEGEADEEELREQRRKAKPKSGIKHASKKARISNGADTTLAIRSANVQSRYPSKAEKLQKARARQSQANQEGLYGKYKSRCLMLLRLISRSAGLWPGLNWRAGCHRLVEFLRGEQCSRDARAGQYDIEMHWLQPQG